MLNKVCLNCGNDFIVSNQNKNQPCCNSKCKTELTNKRKTKPCEHCGKDFVANKPKVNRFCSKECSNNASKAHDDVKCKNCGKEFRYQLKNRNIYCSKQCYSDYTQEQNRLKPKPKRDRKCNFSNVYFNKCIACNNLFTTKTKAKVTCSAECYYSSRQEVFKIECVVCKSMFDTKRKTQKTCSNECKNIRLAERARETTRKARQEGRIEKNSHRKRAKRLNAVYESGITIKKLIKRDGTKCLLCDKEVLKVNESGYHKDNATIGHIISMFNGGSHTFKNVQLECMECNCKKGVNNS